eukprot:332771-Lingulodinium_polyedra.AAC.1
MLQPGLTHLAGFRGPGGGWQWTGASEHRLTCVAGRAAKGHAPRQHRVMQQTKPKCCVGLAD